MTAVTALTTHEVQAAAVELARMRGSLVSWLKYRGINDAVLAGQHRTSKPLAYAQSVVARDRSLRQASDEQDLANKLAALLARVMPGQPLPSADLRDNPTAAVELAQLAIAGGQSVSSPTAAGGLGVPTHPWLWPVLIVGGLLLTVTTAIKTAADVAKDREEKACIEAGACTDYGFWLKAGGVVAIAWYAWKELGLREHLHALTRKGRV